MIRPATILWVALTGTVGFGLYHLKQEVQALDDELFRLNRAILTEQESIHVLRAEWSYINQPTRLQSLASRHLDLRPTKPAQLGTVAGLPSTTPDAPRVTDSRPATPPTDASTQTAQGVVEPAALIRPARQGSR